MAGCHSSLSLSLSLFLSYVCVQGPRVRQRLKTRPAVTSQPKTKSHTPSPAARPIARKYASTPTLPSPSLSSSSKRSVHYADSTGGDDGDTVQGTIVGDKRGDTGVASRSSSSGNGGVGGKVRPLPIPRRVNAPLWSPRNGGARTPRGSRQRKPET
eukprot:TRINITY_DN4449_c0_g4_i1.p1 TRINITY_DN4449_c0_g4~~TRINITY_DN4449_c0_g4_i1.p1  ORF type:complete len:156 (-),score=28.40 TRINITY_DN4449_c0_g4_i1:46-513(-)